MRVKTDTSKMHKRERRDDNPFEVLRAQVEACELCTRLRAHCAEVARVKRRAYRDCEYWGKPVPGFGDPAARILVVGLAPGAHGSNRTGRMFTGDRSGDWLFRALHDAGLASQPTSVARGDGLTLRSVYITAAARCAPPGNRPAPAEIANCRPFLERELDLLPNVRVVVALGRIAMDAWLDVLKNHGLAGSRAAFPFGHGRVFEAAPGRPALIASYHPSQQNTSTGRLTAPMLLDVFLKARDLSE
jgi:uracil-DNA glycosylase family 4